MFIKALLRNVYLNILENKRFSKKTHFYPELKKVERDIFRNKELKKKYPKEINYMKKQLHLSMFPYKFTEKYRKLHIHVYEDIDNNCKYVLHGGKRLYFPEKMLDKEIEAYYFGLLMEQDERSPHRYFSKTFYPSEKDVFVDVGCAEAISSLEIIDNVKGVVLFEYNDMWDKPLKLTFGPYKHKVKFHKIMVADISEGEFSTLDDILSNTEAESFFVKMDIEGYEKKAIKGAKKILSKGNVRLAVCTYHYQSDEVSIIDLLDSYNLDFKYEFSDGYMLNLYSELIYPYFRRGVLRVKR